MDALPAANCGRPALWRAQADATNRNSRTGGPSYSAGGLVAGGSAGVVLTRTSPVPDVFSREGNEGEIE